MVNPREVVEPVRFIDAFDVATLRFNEELAYLQVAYDEQSGFLQVHEAEVAANAIRLVGFGAPKAADGTFDMSEEVTPITRLEDLHSSDQNIDTQGKGVGPRMYNSPPAAFGFTTLPKDGQMGTFTFDIDPRRLLDLRGEQGSALAQIGRHAGRIVTSRFGSLAQTIDAIHADYDRRMQAKNPDVVSPDAVLLGQPPRAGWRQRVERKAVDPLGMPPEFMIIRNPSVLLRRIGSYTTHQ
jgi:hypothetical protein